MYLKIELGRSILFVIQWCSTRNFFSLIIVQKKMGKSNEVVFVDSIVLKGKCQCVNVYALREILMGKQKRKL
ncbi:hypothetical protein BLOT_011089 [Blomia tropicalis]|nr:hypothetical protein BLOT_011089 [Blomia tropicalis]